MKKINKVVFSLLVLLGFFASTSTSAFAQETNRERFIYDFTAEDVANWVPMETPGGGQGTVELGDGAAIIRAKEVDGWGGIQSDMIEIDLSRNPLLFIRVKENGDGFKWGAKFVPSVPEIEEHEWGMYLVEDNNFKWNNYAVVDIKDKLGEPFINLYGEELEGVIWIFASGNPEASVEISEVKVMYLD
ncbi:hypothetical protein ACTQ54_01135 [Fundicoccus sp. Sow4_H7]|uniref:hypothetical protein n=1 Tax=Fundicoccus sp. Sow4_H7 TaxID=3438784 RepID=UPI003F8E8CDC